MEIKDGNATFVVKTITSNEAVKESLDNKDTQWKALYNKLRKCTYPVTFEDAELTALLSAPLNNGTLKLSQPYTDFDGLLIYISNDSQYALSKQYISVPAFEEDIQKARKLSASNPVVYLVNGDIHWRISVLPSKGFNATTFPVNDENAMIQQIYGVKFKELT